MWKRSSNTISHHLPKRELLLLRTVLALPKAMENEKERGRRRGVGMEKKGRNQREK